MPKKGVSIASLSDAEKQLLSKYDFNLNSNQTPILSQENNSHNKFVSKNIAYELIFLCI